MDLQPEPASEPTRTLAQYEARVDHAVKTATLDSDIVIPKPQNRAEVQALLARTVRMAGDLSVMVDKVFPGAKDMPHEDLSGLSLDEKLARGDEVCDKLGAIAYQLAPAKTLEGLERLLATDERSRHAADSLMASLRNA